MALRATNAPPYRAPEACGPSRPCRWPLGITPAHRATAALSAEQRGTEGGREGEAASKVHSAARSRPPRPAVAPRGSPRLPTAPRGSRWLPGSPAPAAGKQGVHKADIDTTPHIQLGTHSHIRYIHLRRTGELRQLRHRVAPAHTHTHLTTAAAYASPCGCGAL